MSVQTLIMILIQWIPFFRADELVVAVWGIGKFGKAISFSS